MNVSLLVKWWWKLDNKEDVWQKIIKHKYLKSDSILDVSHKQSDSAIWAVLLKVKDIYLQGRKKVVRDGKTNFSGRIIGFMRSLFAFYTLCCSNFVNSKIF